MCTNHKPHIKANHKLFYIPIWLLFSQNESVLLYRSEHCLVRQSFMLPGAAMTGTRPPKTEAEVAIVFASRVEFPQGEGAVFEESFLMVIHAGCQTMH